MLTDCIVNPENGRDHDEVERHRIERDPETVRARSNESRVGYGATPTKSVFETRIEILDMEITFWDVALSDDSPGSVDRRQIDEDGRGLVRWRAGIGTALRDVDKKNISRWRMSSV